MTYPFPFDAAIFDLDGTLLDSMGVWTRVDEIYFEKRGMAVPPDYGPALAGLSYRESAEYTFRTSSPMTRISFGFWSGR